MFQQYNGITFNTVSSWTYGANLAALITDQLTAVIEGRREAKEAALSLVTISPGVLGATSGVSVIESSVGGRLDYRIMPNVVIGGGLTYLEDQYLGAGGGGRDDNTWGPLASVKYFASPQITLGFDYRNVSFNLTGGLSAVPTSVAALPFTRNVYLASVNVKF
jgi:hypothetical protein